MLKVLVRANYIIGEDVYPLLQTGVLLDSVYLRLL